MGDQGKCGSCQSCQGGCNSCEGCNKCDGGCQYCIAVCESAQNLCRINQFLSHYKGNFNWKTGDKIICIEQGQVIFNQTTWNQICLYINSRTTIGNPRYTNGTGGPAFSSSKYSKTPWPAKEYNRVYKELASSTEDKVSPGEIIYGSYFSDLIELANKFKINWNACNSCNVGCDGCNSCDGTCNSCNSCDGTQTESCSGTDADCGNCCDEPEPESTPSS